MTVPYPAPVEAQMQRYYPSLSEKDCRRYAAIEAVKLGYGGQAYIRRRLGCHHATLALGLAELNDTATLTVTERHGERGIATLTTPEGTRTLDAALVVAADGKQSPLRRQANIDIVSESGELPLAESNSRPCGGRPTSMPLAGSIGNPASPRFWNPKATINPPPTSVFGPAAPSPFCPCPVAAARWCGRLPTKRPRPSSTCPKPNLWPNSNAATAPKWAS